MKKHKGFTGTIKEQLNEFLDVIDYFETNQETEAMISLESFADNHPDAVDHMLYQAFMQNKISLKSLFEYNEEFDMMVPKLPYEHISNLENAENVLVELKSKLDNLVKDTADVLIASPTSGIVEITMSDFIDIPSLLWYFVTTTDNDESLVKATRMQFNSIIEEKNQLLPKEDRIPLFTTYASEVPVELHSTPLTYDEFAHTFAQSGDLKALARMEKNVYRQH